MFFMFAIKLVQYIYIYGVNKIYIVHKMYGFSSNHWHEIVSKYYVISQILCML